MSQHEPLVCAILLTKDRPAMAARAVRAFRAQTYPNKRLFICDTGAADPAQMHTREEEKYWASYWRRHSIGKLRNAANQLAVSWTGAVQHSVAEVLIHWDDDDVSHPNRIAEQVAHLQSSGADVVGYNEMLFWDSRIVGRIASDVVRITEEGIEADVAVTNGEAWLYKHRTNTPGTSLCYWRKTWERKPFPDLPKPGGGAGEDWHWLKGLNVATVSSVLTGLQTEPRLIASIHGGNTQSYDLEGIIERGSQEWRRAPEWDDYARKAMAL